VTKISATDPNSPQNEEINQEIEQNNQDDDGTILALPPAK
jgi:hypothetical protein